MRQQIEYVRYVFRFIDRGSLSINSWPVSAGFTIMRGIGFLNASSTCSQYVFQRSDAARDLMNLDRKTKFSFLFYSFFSEVITLLLFQRTAK